MGSDVVTIVANALILTVKRVEGGCAIPPPKTTHWKGTRVPEMFLCIIQLSYQLIVDSRDHDKYTKRTT